MWVPIIRIKHLVKSETAQVLENNKYLVAWEQGVFTNYTVITVDLTMKATISCKMDFARFPFDEQECLFVVSKVESEMYQNY